MGIIDRNQLFTAENRFSLLTLTFLEIVLGIHNIIYISVAANKLSANDQPKARNIGLILAMAFRVARLLGMSLPSSLGEPFTHFDWCCARVGLSGPGLLLVSCGPSLIYKRSTDMHHIL